MKQRSKWYLTEFFIVVIAVLGIIGRYVVEVDPFFHYHEPNIEEYYYRLDNQRSQNDGISKRFSYNMLITGTSMTENFKTTEADKIWAEEGAISIKIPYSGATYKEINDSLTRALEHNANLHTIIRGLDMTRFMDSKDAMSYERNYYPLYLYDDNIWNDVEYLFNRDVVFGRTYPMMKDAGEPGIMSFDIYSNWMWGYTFGVNTVLGSNDEDSGKITGEPMHLTEQEKEQLLGNIRQNVTSLAEKYPNVRYYYFFTPYSIVYWGGKTRDGSIYKQIEAERLIIEEILKCENIKLFSFNNRTDITTDLNNYKDSVHYGEWINSLMLRWMHDGEYMLTRENYETYLAEELAFYTSYDYTSIVDQIDYENDYYAAALLNEELYGVVPMVVTDEMLQQSELKSACILQGQFQGMTGVECTGCLQREPDEDRSLSEYLMEDEYIGYKMVIEDIKDYRYLVFYGRKESGDGQPCVYLYDENNQAVAECSADCRSLDNEWHQYLIDITDLEGRVSIIFNGGYTDNTGSEYTKYLFSNVALY